jgi:hypothetical protein
MQQLLSMFERLKSVIGTVADELLMTHDETLTLRGTDYAAALSSSKPLAPVEYQLPLMKQLSRLLR